MDCAQVRRKSGRPFHRPQRDQEDLLDAFLIYGGVSHVRNLARPDDETNPGVIDSIESTLPGGTGRSASDRRGAMTKDGMGGL